MLYGIFSRLLATILFSITCLLLLLTAPVFAGNGASGTEFVWLNNNKELFEFTRKDGVIINTKTTTYTEDGSKFVKENSYDQNGNTRTATKSNFDKNGKQTGSRVETFNYDDRGRLINSEDITADYLNNTGQTHKTERTYFNGSYSESLFLNDHATGKTTHGERTQVYTPSYRKDTAIAEEEYKWVKAQAEREGTKFTLGIPTTPPTPLVPGAPAAPTEYAATSGWLKGAYFSLNLGASFPGSSSLSPGIRENFPENGFKFSRQVGTSFPGGMQPGVSLGATVGQYGAPFTTNPLFQYFGWSVGFDYQRYSLKTQGGTFTELFRLNGTLLSKASGDASLYGDGQLFAINFLFKARYPFLPTSYKPFGAVQVHAGVGPTILISSLEPGVKLISVSRFNEMPVHFPLNRTYELGGSTTVTGGLAVEGGVRVYPHKNIFLGVLSRFLFGQASQDYNRRNADSKLILTIRPTIIKAEVGYEFD